MEFYVQINTPTQIELFTLWSFLQVFWKNRYEELSPGALDVYGSHVNDMLTLVQVVQVMLGLLGILLVF